jgi:Carboxypeptidase regulatory-like domain
MRFLAICAGLFLAGFATSPDSSACSLSFFPISVGSNFKVKVSGYDGPVHGLLLNLMDIKGPMLSAVTDDKGIAEFYISEFYAVPPGTLFLGADHDSGIGGLQLNVKSNGPADVIVPMRWPSKEPIHVRSLSGTMRAPDARPGQLEQPVLSLELLEGISGRVLSTISTTARGEFDFGKLVPGLYFIRLKPYVAFNQQVGGLISVAVDPNAPAQVDKLDLSLTWSSCGLMYTDLRQCPQPDLHVKKLEGHASDPEGRAVRRAEIVLLDAAQNQVAHASTDSAGNFSYPGPLAGTFELRIEGAGLNPVHTPIHIEPTALNSSLEIDAAYGDICSGVWAR